MKFDEKQKQNYRDSLLKLLEGIDTIYIVEKCKTKSYRLITLLIVINGEIMSIDRWVGPLLSDYDFERDACKVRCFPDRYIATLGLELYGDAGHFNWCYP